MTSKPDGKVIHHINATNFKSNSFSFVLPAIALHPIELLEFRKISSPISWTRGGGRVESGIRKPPYYRPLPFSFVLNHKMKRMCRQSVMFQYRLPWGFWLSRKTPQHRYISTPLNNIYYLRPPSPLSSEHKEQAFPFSSPFNMWLPSVKEKKIVNKGFYTVFCISMPLFFKQCSGVSRRCGGIKGSRPDWLIWKKESIFSRCAVNVIS